MIEIERGNANWRPLFFSARGLKMFSFREKGKNMKGGNL